jgi:hypothetical protein
MRQGLLKRGLHLFGRSFRSYLRCHIVQMTLQVLDVLTVLAFDGAGDNI